MIELGGLVEQVVVERDLLLKFAGAILREHRGRSPSDVGEVDGAAVEEAALACGLLERRVVDAPCGENCVCAEVTEFPTECNFTTELGRRAIRASR